MRNSVFVTVLVVALLSVAVPVYALSSRGDVAMSMTDTLRTEAYLKGLDAYNVHLVPCLGKCLSQLCRSYDSHRLTGSEIIA